MKKISAPVLKCFSLRLNDWLQKQYNMLMVRATESWQRQHSTTYYQCYYYCYCYYARCTPKLGG